jgi:hypothetical protein
MRGKLGAYLFEACKAIACYQYLFCHKPGILRHFENVRESKPGREFKESAENMTAFFNIYFP